MDSYNEYDQFGKNDDINTDVMTVMAHCVWSADEEVELMCDDYLGIDENNITAKYVAGRKII